MPTGKIKYACPGCKFSTENIIKLPSAGSHRQIETSCENCGSRLKVRFMWRDRTKTQLGVQCQILKISDLLQQMLVEEAQIRAGVKTPEVIENEKTNQQG